MAKAQDQCWEVKMDFKTRNSSKKKLEKESVNMDPGLSVTRGITYLYIHTLPAFLVSIFHSDCRMFI